MNKVSSSVAETNAPFNSCHRIENKRRGELVVLMEKTCPREERREVGPMKRSAMLPQMLQFVSFFFIFHFQQKKNCKKLTTKGSL